MKRLMLGVAAALAVTGLAAGCTNDPSYPDVPEHQFDAAGTTITYEFTDGSVPPEYHRSFTLTVADGTGTIVVDSYGDEIATDEQEVSSAAVEDLVASYNAGELNEVFYPADVDDEGCAGGQTFALTFADGTEQASTSIYRCAEGTDEPALALAGAASPLLESFDIETLTEERYRY